MGVTVAFRTVSSAFFYTKMKCAPMSVRSSVEVNHTLQFFPQNVILFFSIFLSFSAYSFETLLTFFMKHRGTFDCRVDLSPCFLYTFKKNQRAPPFHHSHHASRARQLCRYLWHCFVQARSCSSFVSRKCEILYIRLEGSIQLPDFVIQSLVSFNESASLSCGSMQVASLHLPRLKTTP